MLKFFIQLSKTDQCRDGAWIVVFSFLVPSAFNFSKFLFSWSCPGDRCLWGTAGPGFFLLGASGRTGRFLFFHNPISVSL